MNRKVRVIMKYKPPHKNLNNKEMLNTKEDIWPKLRTPEKSQELLDYKQKRNARAQELCQAKKMLNMQQNEKQLNVQGNVECANKSRHPKKTFIA